MCVCVSLMMVSSIAAFSELYLGLSLNWFSPKLDLFGITCG